MYHLGLVALGGGIGAGFRHLANVAASRLFGAGFPVGTLVVNVGGGLLMGILAGHLALGSRSAGEELRLFLATGVLGGFTTFSAFSLDAVMLWERGEVLTALAYVVASVVLSILALVAGLAIARAVS